ncbi:SigB/SigF/SigG family RNA polymerase sigma factor [Williamsia deligens]|uniref:SigB/SigF/SigG family RNA polymerase sigma factor n=2 Tax=Williamsia deligens TaxID=321325 RepID=A0ABW3G6Q8_9NOCA
MATLTGVQRELLRDRVIARCLPLADHVARRFGGRGEPYDDLLQVARVGLVNSVDRYDPERGSDFLSFAVPTVMGEVRRYFRDSAWCMRVPRRTKENYLQIKRVSDVLIQQLGRSPRPAEIAAETGLSIDDVVDGLVAGASYHTTSIDAEYGTDSSTSSIRETMGARDDRLGQIDELVSVRPVLDALPERERRILILRYFDSMSQSQIAREVGISQMHVSRILAATLGRLRAGVADDPVIADAA